MAEGWFSMTFIFPTLGFGGMGRERLGHLDWAIELEKMGIGEKKRETEISQAWPVPGAAQET